MFEAMLSRIGEVQERAGVKTVFGEPHQVNGRTIIAVARVSYGFGFGGGRGNGKAATAGADSGEAGAGPESARRGATAGSDAGGGGGGGRLSVRPVAVLEIGGSETKVRPIIDVTRLAVAGMLLVGWSVFWITYTARKTAALR
jgi:uncharacterized spore protein YtfJ